MRTAAAGYPLRLSSGGQLPVPSALYARILTLQICTVIILQTLCFVKRKLCRGRRFPVLYKVPALFFSKIGQLSRARHAPASVGAVVPFPRPCHRGKQNAGRTGRTGKRGEAEQRRTRGEQVIRQHGNTSGQARSKPLLQRICGCGTRTASGGVQGLLRPRHPIHAARRAGTWRPDSPPTRKPAAVPGQIRPSGRLRGAGAGTGIPQSAHPCLPTPASGEPALPTPPTATPSAFCHPGA